MLVQNVGKIDRAIRLSFALILLYVGAFVMPGSLLGVTFATAALILLMTGTLGFCPLYRFFRFSTNTDQVRKHL